MFVTGEIMFYSLKTFRKSVVVIRLWRWLDFTRNKLHCIKVYLFTNWRTIELSWKQF